MQGLKGWGEVGFPDWKWASGGTASVILVTVMAQWASKNLRTDIRSYSFL